MRLVIQRVKRAKVISNGKAVGEIGPGLFVLVGIGKDDELKDAEVLAKKLVEMRVMADPPSPKASEGQVKTGKMNLSAKDVGAEILLVSQFTLYADTSTGRRPSFINAASPEKAKELYDHFVKKVKESGVKVATGSFGNYMEIDLTADGPVTIIL